MTTFDPIRLAAAKARGKRPFFLDDPQAEQTLSIAMAVAGELAVVRERMDTIERLLEEAAVIKRQAIEAYVPGEDAARERMRWQAEYASRILRIVQQQREALEEALNDQDCEDLADEFSRS